MTKPTGRPKGRPKGREYVTLMARVPQDLADRAKHYAGRKRQTMSDVLRDALTLLLAESDSSSVFVYDRNTENVSDSIEDVSTPLPDIMSDTKQETAASVPAEEEALPENVSDMKEDTSFLVSYTKEAVIARLRQMRASGLSYAQIAKQLNAEGQSTISGKGTWNKGTVLKQLR